MHAVREAGEHSNGICTNLNMTSTYSNLLSFIHARVHTHTHTDTLDFARSHPHTNARRRPDGSLCRARQLCSSRISISRNSSKAPGGYCLRGIKYTHAVRLIRLALRAGVRPHVPALHADVGGWGGWGFCWAASNRFTPPGGSARLEIERTRHYILEHATNLSREMLIND